MIHHLLVSLTRSNANEAAVRTALALARLHAARLTTVLADDCRSAVTARAAPHGEVERDDVRRAPGVASSVVRARASRVVDLSVIGGAYGTNETCAAEVGFRSVLDRSRASVLVVPQDRKPGPMRRAALLWDRALDRPGVLAAATALLAAGATVELWTRVTSDFIAAHDEDACVATAARLARDGFIVRLFFVRRDPVDRPGAAMRQALERPVDLLVIPFVEGATRAGRTAADATTEAFRTARVPVLFAR